MIGANTQCGEAAGLIRARHYLDALGAEPVIRDRLLHTLQQRLPAQAEPSDALALLHQLLAAEHGGGEQAQENPPESSVTARTVMHIGKRLNWSADESRLPSAPSLERASMSAAQPQPGLRGRLGGQPETSPPAVVRDQRARLNVARRLRQLMLALLVGGPAALATAYMASMLPHHGGTFLEMAILALALMLFGWILVGFWSAMAGFWVLLRGDRYSLQRQPETTEGVPKNLPEDARTAVIMPICEEDVERTFAGLRASYESLRETGYLDNFDFYVLSDSADPAIIAAEQLAWSESCTELDAFERLYYRRRRSRVKRKSGNIADFCRRWGSRYRYMVVLDADSLMAGTTVVELLRLMEANPQAGLIQTVPTAANRMSVLARVQQFATGVYGRMFAAGLNYWHLDTAYYWGHNAIIRVEPFRQHCALPRLPGKGALGGEILSHDFVEAALMSRAGWGVYIAYHLGGSYEELPPNLLEELKRDRRWCQGNLQHAGLLFADRVAPAHRALFTNGVMAYGSALIWLCFLALSSFEVGLEAMRGPEYFPEPGALFPEWPVWQPVWALSLFGGTLLVLFLPKILGLLRVIGTGRAGDYGGRLRLTLSVMLEIVLTTLLAPIRMLSHARFVSLTLLGLSVPWPGGQQRDDVAMPWARALRYHGPGAILAIIWAGTLFWLSPGFAWWLMPVLLPLAIAPAITVYSASPGLGNWLRQRRIALIPEEENPPPLISRLQELLRRPVATVDAEKVVVWPYENALHCAMASLPGRLAPAIRDERNGIRQRAFAQGMSSLSLAEQKQLLADRRQLSQLHHQIWTSKTWPVAWSQP